MNLSSSQPQKWQLKRFGDGFWLSVGMLGSRADEAGGGEP